MTKQRFSHEQFFREVDRILDMNVLGDSFASEKNENEYDWEDVRCDKCQYWRRHSQIQSNGYCAYFPSGLEQRMYDGDCEGCGKFYPRGEKFVRNP